jgi:hypothetical protein
MPGTSGQLQFGRLSCPREPGLTGGACAWRGYPTNPEAGCAKYARFRIADSPLQ